jgi:hypothetical protein
MRAFARDNGLALFFGTIFGAALLAQSFAGQRVASAEEVAHGGSPVSWWEYVRSPEFWGAVMENWQSEFLQFALFIGATIWLVQRGSNESKALVDTGLESDRKQRVGRHATADSPWLARVGGVGTRLYQNSLLLVMSAIFAATWFAQSLNNWRAYNAAEQRHDGTVVSWSAYVLEPDFWERTLQNWQSEFLAVGTMAVFTIYLRQRGSHESKPVGAPHDETASSG